MISVTQVNRGKPEPLDMGNRVATTGIFKQPVEGPVAVGEEGLESDAIMDRKHHGGPDQAVYLYRTEDYEFWSRQLRRDIEPGTFGENLTVNGLSGPGLMVGDRLVLPNLELQVSAPRIPCNVLAARMGDKKFAKMFVQAERPGIYCRVLRTGTVTAGDTLELIPFEEDSISTIEFFRDFHRKMSMEEMKRYLALPIDIRSRTYLEGEVAKG